MAGTSPGGPWTDRRTGVQTPPPRRRAPAMAHTTRPSMPLTHFDTQPGAFCTACDCGRRINRARAVRHLVTHIYINPQILTPNVAASQAAGHCSLNVLLHCSTSKPVLNVALSSPAGYRMSIECSLGRRALNSGAANGPVWTRRLAPAAPASHGLHYINWGGGSIEPPG